MLRECQLILHEIHLVLRHMNVITMVLCSLMAAYGMTKNARAQSAPVKKVAKEAPATGPRLTDEQLFDMLDLSRPELAAVKAAVDKRDWPAATHALAQYLRERKTPHWNFESHKSVRGSEYRNHDADDVMRHRMTSIGIPWQFGEKIDWRFNPTTQPGSKWAANHEWTWQLSRHAAWLDLCEAWRASGQEKYAAEFVKQLRSWVHDCPVPVSKATNVPYSPWRTIEAGIRAGSVWPSIFFGFLSAPSFDDEAVVLMVKSYVEHAQYLLRFHSKGGNWLTMEANGLYHAGALFPEFKDAAKWREAGLGLLYAELDNQVYPDGAQIELAPSYHGVSLRNMLGPVLLTPMTGFEVPASYVGKIERMYDYLLYSMQPTGEMPPLNDSGAGDVGRYLATGAQLFPKRADFQWAATAGKEGEAPKIASHEFPYAGQFVMRGGWERDALWLLMDGGPFGFGHQHEDKLNVILTAYGRPLLVEGGVYTYDSSPWRRYVLSSRAHNLVMVDGQDQSRRRQPRESFVVKTPLPHVWKSTEQYDYAEAAYDEGWGPQGERSVKQTRGVWFLKPQKCFVVVDELESLDGKEHRYESLFHLDAKETAVDGLRVATKNIGPNLTIFNLGAEGVRIVKGQKEPEVQGWIPDSRSGYGGIRPIPTAIYSKSGSGTVKLVTVLYPTPAGKACPLRAVRETQDGLTLTWDDGKEEAVKLEK